METRKITIVSTKNQKRYTIMSAATTLAELKADLRQNNIDYTDMTFYEGTSKTELKDDASVLPHDVPYKDIVTNELVFMLTNTNKKIRSGSMTRAEAYIAIKANNLQDECMRRFGKNFTMCKTVDLVTLVEENTVKSTHVRETTVYHAPKTTSKDCCTNLKNAFTALVDALVDNGSLEDYEAEDIKDILEGTTKETHVSSYSDSEIDNMFSFVNA